jgi:outer membrane lipoprotein
MTNRSLHVIILCLALLLAGCSSSRLAVPEVLESLIDKTVTFADVLASPDSNKGRLVVVGGQLLWAKRLEQGTRFELLQLPLDKDQAPTTDLTLSQGRIMALHQESLDTATVKSGTRVTFVGEVRGCDRETGRNGLSLPSFHDRALACLATTDF